MIRNRKVPWPLVGYLILAGAIGLNTYLDRIDKEDRIKSVDFALYQTCLKGERRDDVIVEQLHAAQRRITLPQQSQAYKDAFGAIQVGIDKLEPKGELPCQREVKDD